MSEITAYLGLGSNLGPRWDNLKLALRMLDQGPGQTSGGYIRVQRTSQVYETPPWGLVDQPDFLNCAVEVATTLEPHGLLQRVKSVETEMGRQPGPRYGPRLIDVDILLYGDLVLEETGLQVPHPRLHLRAFALVPLAELASSLAHPVIHETIGRLAENAEGQDALKPLGPLSWAGP